MLITVGRGNATMWADVPGAAAGTYARTVDTVTLSELPVGSTEGLLTDTATGTLTGTLTCASTAAVV